MNIALGITVGIFVAVTWGALIYLVVVEPVRWYLQDRKPHPRREEFQEREAQAFLWPTTDRRVVGQPATPFDLTNEKSARAGGSAGRVTGR